MANIKFVLSFIVILVVFSGCGGSPEPKVETVKQFHVTYQTNPSGAMLVCGGQNFGYTPQRLSYNIMDSYGFAYVQPCTVTWVSGATATSGENGTLRIDYAKYNNSILYTFQRPNVVGLDKDMAFSLKVEQQKAQQRQQEYQQLQQLQMYQQSQERQSYQNLQNTLDTFNNNMEKTNSKTRKQLNETQKQLDDTNNMNRMIYGY